MTPILSQNQIERIERNKENKNSSTTWVDPKKNFQTLPQPKNSPLWPQKVKKAPTLSQNKMTDLKETYKMKVVRLHE